MYKDKNTRQRFVIDGCLENQRDLMQWAGKNLEANTLFLIYGFRYTYDGDGIELGNPITITKEQFGLFDADDHDNYDIDPIFDNYHGALFIDEEQYSQIINNCKKPTAEDLEQVLRAEFKLLKAWCEGNVYGYVVETNYPITREQFSKIVTILNGNSSDEQYDKVCEIIGYAGINNKHGWREIESCWKFYQTDTDKELFLLMSEHWSETADVKEIKQQMGV
jgi:hypothetical protein